MTATGTRALASFMRRLILRRRPGPTSRRPGPCRPGPSARERLDLGRGELGAPGAPGLLGREGGGKVGKAPRIAGAGRLVGAAGARLAFDQQRHAPAIGVETDQRRLRLLERGLDGLLVGDHRLLGAGVLRLQVGQPARDRQDRLGDRAADGPVARLGREAGLLHPGPADARREHEGGEEIEHGQLLLVGGRAHGRLGLPHVGAALEQVARQGLGHGRRLAHLGRRGEVGGGLHDAARQDQEGALLDLEFGFQRFGLSAGLGEFAGDAVRLRAGGQADGGALGRHVIEFLLDPGGLAGVGELDRQPPGLVPRIHGRRRDLGARGLVGEPHPVHLGAGRGVGQEASAEGIDLPAHVEVRARLLRDPAGGESGDVGDRARDLIGVGAPRRSGGVASGQVLKHRADTLGAYFVQARPGRPDIGIAGQGLLDQRRQFRIAVDRPPGVEVDRAGGRSGARGFIGGRQGRVGGTRRAGGEGQGGQDRQHGKDRGDG